MVKEKSTITAGQVLYYIISTFTIPALVFFLAGDWFWFEGWIFGILTTAMSLTVCVYLYFKDPALLAERFRRPGTGNQVGWDKYFVLVSGIGFFVWLAIMPLDAKRYGWTTNFPIWLEVLGSILLLISIFFLIRSFTDNPFLSPLVRIQKERKQYVVTTGVYGLVRHPMYLGVFLYLVGTPMLLGSIYGMIAGVIMSFLFVLRIIGEEKLLARELEGYAEYQKKVKYRLIPMVW